MKYDAEDCWNDISETESILTCVLKLTSWRQKVCKDIVFPHNPSAYQYN